MGSKRRRVLSPLRHVSSHVSCHVVPRVATCTTWLPRGNGGHHLTRPLIGGQSPLTGGPVVVDRWSDGGRRWSAAVDCRWPLLTATVDRWSDGGFGDGVGTVDRTRGTNHRVTRGNLIIRYEWIQLQTAGGYE
ncbi:hypothetical protein Tco_1241270, partial [Tanacetum coccineum]